MMGSKGKNKKDSIFPMTPVFFIFFAQTYTRLYSEREVPIHHKPEPLYELLLSKFYFISLTSSPFSFRSTVTSWASFVVIITL